MSERDAQWLGALGRANEVRRARARLKRELAAGTLSIVEVLANPPVCIETAKVKQLLLALPHFGPVKAGRLLTRCQIGEGKTVAGLTDRQRAALIERLSVEPTARRPRQDAAPAPKALAGPGRPSQTG